jgi:hypothetical protein
LLDLAVAVARRDDLDGEIGSANEKPVGVRPALFPHERDIWSANRVGVPTKDEARFGDQDLSEAEFLDVRAETDVDEGRDAAVLPPFGEIFLSSPSTNSTPE